MKNWHVEIKSTLEDGTEVIMRGIFADAEPDVGIMKDYLDDHEIVAADGSPLSFEVSEADFEVLIAELMAKHEAQKRRDREDAIARRHGF